MDPYKIPCKKLGYLCVYMCVREREREWGRKGGKEREFEETVLKEIKQAVV